MAVMSKKSDEVPDSNIFYTSLLYPNSRPEVLSLLTCGFLVTGNIYRSLQSDKTDRCRPQSHS
jgi:hypothetical protein